jgi:hypothetical protein
MNHTILTYSPSDFSSMEDSAKQALMDRYNGVFAPLEISAEAFKAAYDTPDIGPHIEKDYKGLSYLSWPFAFRYLKEHFPTLFVAFEEKTIGWPVFGEPGAFILRPYLTDGIKRTPALVFPVMDRKHNSIQQLDGRAISDNIQRASVKAIATFTGLGLRLYAGEDIPKEEAPKIALQQDAPKPARAVKKAATATTGGTSDAGAEGPATTADTGTIEPFDAKTALTAVCKANPLNYADEKASLAAGKAALESIGLARATEVKTWQAFGNVVAAMMTLWAKQEQIVISKAEMTEEINAVRSLQDTEAMIEGLKAFVAKKQ